MQGVFARVLHLTDRPRALGVGLQVLTLASSGRVSSRAESAVAYGTKVTVVMNGSPVSGTIALGLVQGPVANP